MKAGARSQGRWAGMRRPPTSAAPTIFLSSPFICATPRRAAPRCGVRGTRTT